MQASQRVTEISGKPGKVWGNVLVPAGGSVIVKITGDTLQTTVKSGVEKTDSWVRIQNIDSVEVVEAPEYTLLAIGIVLVLSALGTFSGSAIFGFILLIAGIACIVYSFIKKRRLLVIYSLRYTIPIFMNKSATTYQQFAEHVMAIARHLNAPPAMQPANRPANGRQATPQAHGQKTGMS
jgi:hypothetical protein